MLFKLIDFVILHVGLWEERKITNCWWFKSWVSAFPVKCESNSGVG